MHKADFIFFSMVFFNCILTCLTLPAFPSPYPSPCPSLGIFPYKTKPKLKVNIEFNP